MSIEFKIKNEGDVLTLWASTSGFDEANTCHTAFSYVDAEMIIDHLPLALNRLMKCLDMSKKDVD